MHPGGQEGVSQHTPGTRRRRLIGAVTSIGRAAKLLNRNSDRIPRGFCRAAVLRMLRGSSIELQPFLYTVEKHVISKSYEL
jgi:hypothetical protein